MAQLRIEIWRYVDPRNGVEQWECGAVDERSDRLREPDAICREVFHASTHEEAMSHYHAANGWEPYKPVPGVTDAPFTDAQKAEQDAYLAVRTIDPEVARGGAC